MSKAVVDGTLQHVSPSQINEFTLCQRKWYFNKVLDLPQPETPEQARGTQIHKQMEDYFEKGIEPTHPSALIALRLPQVPKRDDAPIIEEPRNYGLGLLAAGVPVRGRIDVQVPPATRLTRPDEFWILDWKSKGNFRFLKGPEQLARDPQGIVYLKYGHTKWPEAKTGRFGHISILVGGGSDAKPRMTDPMTKGEVNAAYEELEETVWEMRGAAGIKDAEDVPANLSACFAFGPKKPCPYLSMCPRVTSKTIAELMAKDEIETPTTEETVSLKEKLQARRAATTDTTTADAPGVLATGINPPDAAQPDPVTPWSPPAADATPIPAPATPTATAPGLTLYVNCLPTRGAGPHMRLEDEIWRRTPSVLETCRRMDPRAVPDGAVDVREVKFGQGTSALVADFKRHPPIGTVVASSTGLSGQVVEALSPLALLVVEAVR